MMFALPRTPFGWVVVFAQVWWLSVRAPKVKS